MRRCAVFERVEHVAEAQFRFFRRDREQFFEDGLLHVGLMDTDRAAAEFDAIHDDVVMLAANFFRISFQQRDVFRDGCGERMMAGIPAVLFAIKAEQRKFDDPEKIKLLRIYHELPLPFQNLGAIKANLAEDFASVQPLVGGEENQIAFLNRELGGERGFLGFAEKFHDGRFPFAAFDLNERETFRTKTLGVFGHGLNLALRRAGHAFRVECFDHATSRNLAAKHFERARFEIIRHVHEFHREARVGLINAIAVQRLLERDALEGRRHVDVQGGFPDALEQAFNERVNIFAVNEAHLDVHLRELGLAVGTQIFVAIAAGELKIFLHAGDHENLFELLRRLRQGVERPGFAAVGHEEFARAFGRGLEQRGRLNFEEALLIHVAPRGDGDLGTQFEVARHFGTAQVEIAILQTQFFVHLAGDFGIIDGERQDFRHVQDFERGDADFHFAGGNLRIVRAFRTMAHLAGQTHDALAAKRRGLREEFRRQIARIKNRLRAAFAVADVYENEAAEVAAGMNPAGERDGLPDVCRAQFVAMMRAFHEIVRRSERALWLRKRLISKRNFGANG